jgi:hypothetical protein
MRLKFQDQERIWKGAVVLILRYCPNIRLEELRKSTEILSEGSQSPGRHFYSGPHENEAEVLTT